MGIRVSQVFTQVVYDNTDAPLRVTDFFIQALWPVLEPRITSLTPDNGAIGTEVTIDGFNFGASQGAGSVKFGVTTATITSWSDTSIVCAVPVGASGIVLVTVTNNDGLMSLGTPFTAPAPALGRSFVVMVG